MINTGHIFTLAKGTGGFSMLQISDTLIPTPNFDGEIYKATLQTVIAIATLLMLFLQKRKKN